MVPVAHGGSGTAFKADVTGADASPLSNENFSVMTPGDRKQFVWMQNAEPLSLDRADEEDGESLRACEQINEALLAYKIGGIEVEPALAEKYTANADLTEWTFNLRKGVKFTTAATCLPRTWSRALQPSGMRRTRSTRGAPASSPTSTRCSGPS